MRRIIEHGKRSERRACALMNLSRDAYRHPPQVSDSDQLLQAELVHLAHERPRFGYRRLALMVQSRRTEVINVKRVRRLYCELGLMVAELEDLVDLAAQFKQRTLYGIGFARRLIEI